MMPQDKAELQPNQRIMAGAIVCTTSACVFSCIDDLVYVDDFVHAYVEHHMCQNRCRKTDGRTLDCRLCIYLSGSAGPAVLCNLTSLLLLTRSSIRSSLAQDTSDRLLWTVHPHTQSYYCARWRSQPSALLCRWFLPSSYSWLWQ